MVYGVNNQRQHRYHVTYPWDNNCITDQMLKIDGYVQMQNIWIQDLDLDPGCKLKMSNPR